MRKTIVIVCMTAMLYGCSSKTVHFEGRTIEEIQIAYDQIFYPPPLPARKHSSPNRGSGMFDFNLDFSGADWSALSDLHRARQCLLGIWDTSSEQRWKNNRYERCYSTWWLIIPVEIDSEKATVKQVDNGVDLTIEFYPANDDNLEGRFMQVRNNLDISQP